MAVFTFAMVSGWKSVRGNMVDITILDVGNVSVAFVATLTMDSATCCCCALRSFVPTWTIMWLGLPKFALFSSSRASAVLGHHSFAVFWPGKSCSSFMNFPFESIRMTTSASIVEADWSWLVWWGSGASACVAGGGPAAKVSSVQSGVGGVVGVFGCTVRSSLLRSNLSSSLMF